MVAANHHVTNGHGAGNPPLNHAVGTKGVVGGLGSIEGLHNFDVEEALPYSNLREHPHSTSEESDSDLWEPVVLGWLVL
jgi:hypothetical protein